MKNNSDMPQGAHSEPSILAIDALQARRPPFKAKGRAIVVCTCVAWTIDTALLLNRMSKQLIIKLTKHMLRAYNEISKPVKNQWPCSNRSSGHLLFAGLLLLTLINNLAFAANTGPSRLLLTTQLWPPYQTHTDGQIDGLATLKAKCALGKMNQPYQITMTGWDRAQLLVQSGKQHGFFVATQNTNRDEYASLSVPLGHLKSSWYFAPGISPNISELSKLSLKVSAKFGSNKWFQLKRQGFNVVKKPRNTKALLKLLKDREINAVLEDELVFRNELHKAGLPNDYFKSQLLETKPMGVYFLKSFLAKYPGFLDQFNNAAQLCEIGKS